MGSNTTLKAADGHSFDAYVAQPPEGKRYGGIVVIQEIFGVNSHIRNVADGYAAAGYVAIAPALYDRVQRNYESGYEQAEIQAGMTVRGKVPNEGALADIKAAMDTLAAQDLSIGIVGYCWGGNLVWQSACKLDGLSAAVSYYGGGVQDMGDLQAKCPTMLHFGEKDHAIPIDKVKVFISKQPKLPVHVYDANHGFNCDQRGSYDAPSAKLALERTLAFFGENLGK
jgi:carboxymethylenebutenolidase